MDLALATTSVSTDRGLCKAADYSSPTGQKVEAVTDANHGQPPEAYFGEVLDSNYGIANAVKLSSSKGYTNQFVDHEGFEEFSRHGDTLFVKRLGQRDLTMAFQPVQFSSRKGKTRALTN